jgi:hypothetical protein
MFFFFALVLQESAGASSRDLFEIRHVTNTKLTAFSLIFLYFSHASNSSIEIQNSFIVFKKPTYPRQNMRDKCCLSLLS